MCKVCLKGLTGAVLFFVFMSGGCSPKPAKYAIFPSVETQEKVVFLDNRLRNDLRIEDITVGISGSDRVLAKLKVINLRDKPIECRVKYKFKGDDGFTLDETSWMPIVFDRREVTHLEQKTLSVKAVDFTVLLRYEKKLKGFK
ncbi:MAG: hypothetical protein KAJ46_01555 [Sedimentisphaerales bacterium]|nr:hypothetical protein [Sedimentisphaerales bacterium]